MSSFICLPQRRRPIPAGPINEELAAILAARPKRTVAERIEELEEIDIDLADLEWIANNRKGGIQAWAINAISDLDT